MHKCYLLATEKVVMYIVKFFYLLTKLQKTNQPVSQIKQLTLKLSE
jgi:hypothetical protein